MALRRRWASSSASICVRSDRATARSAWRPSTDQLAVVVPLDPVALGDGPVHDEGLRLGQLGPCLLHGLGHRPPASGRMPGAGDRARSRRPLEGRRRRRPGRPATRRRRGADRAGRAGSGASSPRRIRSCSAGGCSARGGEVEQQHEHPGPLDVAQELVAEAPALAGALDEAGEVGDDELVSSSRRTTPRFGSSVVNG